MRTHIYVGWKCLKHTIIGLVKLLPSPTCHKQTSPSVSLTQHWKKPYTWYWKKKQIFFKKTGLKKISEKDQSLHKVNSFKITSSEFWDIHLLKSYKRKISDEKMKVDIDLVALRTKQNLGDFGEGPGLPQHC